jgi:hypothetical protein
MSAYSDKIKREKEKGLYKNSDLDGKEATHTIDRLLQDITMFDKQMDVLTFSDSAKQLQVNVTNGDTLIQLFGDDPDDWHGHRITLFLDEYKPGKFGIRIRSAASRNGSLPATRRGSDMDDDIPF